MIKIVLYTILGFLLSILGTIYFFLNAGNNLVVDTIHSQDHFPYAMLLMGDVESRTQTTIDLYHQGFIERILFFEPEQNAAEKIGIRKPMAQLTEEYLLAHHIPKENIFRVQGVVMTSTFDEALSLKKWFTQQAISPKKILLITSWYHTSRALWAFNKVFDQDNVEIKMAAAFDKEIDIQRWWQTERGFLTVFNEYLKWVYYLFFHPMTRGGKNLLLQAKVNE